MSTSPPAQRRDDTDPESWLRRAIDAHERELVSYATRLLGDLERGRDAAQETFLRLVRAVRDGDPAGLGRGARPLRPWLFRVCRTRALDRIAKEASMGTTTEGRAGSAATNELADRRDGDPARAALAAEEAGRLAALLAELPASQREALELKFRHGLSYREIAEVTENAIGQVSWLIHRGMRALRERLASDIRSESLEGLA